MGLEAQEIAVAASMDNLISQMAIARLSHLAIALRLLRFLITINFRRKGSLQGTRTGNSNSFSHLTRRQRSSAPHSIVKLEHVQVWAPQIL